MNHFDDRTIDQIAGDEIAAMVHLETPEDQWLDFKAAPWPHTSSGTFKLLHDITAFANGEGGYLIVGVTTNRKQGRDISTGLRHVAESVGESQRIRSLCQEFVDPPISRLEVQPKPVQRSDGPIDVIAVRVPVSVRRPHAFRWRDSTVFVSRYGTDVRFMPVSELGRELSRLYFPETETNRRLGELAEEIRALQRLLLELNEAPPSPTSGPLAVTDVDRLIEYMDERFRQITRPVVGYRGVWSMNVPKPTYRIFTVPERLDRALVNTRSPDVRALLTSPPGLRPNSFGYRGLSKTQLTPEGIEGAGLTAEQEIVLLENGYFELRCPLRNALFQMVQGGVRVPGR